MKALYLIALLFPTFAQAAPQQLNAVRVDKVGDESVFYLPGIFDGNGSLAFLVAADSNLSSVCKQLGAKKATASTPKAGSYGNPYANGIVTFDGDGKITKITDTVDEKSPFLEYLACE